MEVQVCSCSGAGERVSWRPITRREFEETIEGVRRSHDAAARLAVESPAEILMIPENLSSECVGVAFYEKFMRDYEETWAQRIREAGNPDGLEQRVRRVRELVEKYGEYS